MHGNHLKTEVNSEQESGQDKAQLSTQMNLTSAMSIQRQTEEFNKLPQLESQYSSSELTREDIEFGLFPLLYENVKKDEINNLRRIWEQIPQDQRNLCLEHKYKLEDNEITLLEYAFKRENYGAIEILLGNSSPEQVFDIITQMDIFDQVQDAKTARELIITLTDAVSSGKCENNKIAALEDLLSNLILSYKLQIYFKEKNYDLLSEENSKIMAETEEGIFKYLSNNNIILNNDQLRLFQAIPNSDEFLKQIELLGRKEIIKIMCEALTSEEKIKFFTMQNETFFKKPSLLQYVFVNKNIEFFKRLRDSIEVNHLFLFYSQQIPQHDLLTLVLSENTEINRRFLSAMLEPLNVQQLAALQQMPNISGKTFGDLLKQPENKWAENILEFEQEYKKKIEHQRKQLYGVVTETILGIKRHPLIKALQIIEASNAKSSSNEKDNIFTSVCKKLEALEKLDAIFSPAITKPLPALQQIPNALGNPPSGGLPKQEEQQRRVSFQVVEEKVPAEKPVRAKHYRLIKELKIMGALHAESSISAKGNPVASGFKKTEKADETKRKFPVNLKSKAIRKQDEVRKKAEVKRGPQL